MVLQTLPDPARVEFSAWTFSASTLSGWSWRGRALLAAMVLLTFCHIAEGGDELSPDVQTIDAAIRKSLPLLAQGMKGSYEQRKQCFNCHNQGLPLMAMSVARSRGIPVDAELVDQQLKFTADFLARNRQRYRDGQGQGGQIDTAGYALWTLNQGDWPADEATAAVVDYLLIYQNTFDHYEPDSERPPGEQSHFTSTYVAVRGMKDFGTGDQQELIAARLERVREWVLKTAARDNEDRVFRLRLVQGLDCAADEIQGARDELISAQHPDGGWSQTAEMSCDSYATATALVALHESGALPIADDVYRAGLRYLIEQQLEDGSWHVVSHCKPFQAHFESGYPHGKDQFISIAAASWATRALALAMPIPAQDSK